MARIVPLLRLAHAGFVLAREGVFSIAALPDPPPPIALLLRLARLVERRGVARTDAAQRLTEACNRLGPSYVKLGQFLATRADVVGQEAAAEFSKLQDRVPPVPDAEARAAVEAALGQPIDSLFVEFGPAVAAASIAQVHPAIVRDPDGGTRKVAVKVLRPGVTRAFARDVESFYIAARLFEAVVPAARRLRPVAVVDTLARSVTFEMDLRLEAAALSEMNENIADDPDFRVPTVDWRRTARSVLTMEWIDGIRLTDVEKLRAAGHDLVHLSEVVIQSFLRHAMRDGFFHADMHQGNLFVANDGALVAVDFGITGRLNAEEQRFLAEILYGFITRDYARVARVHFEAGYVPASQDVDLFAQAIRAIGEPIRGQTANEISMARLLTQLFEVTDLFEMRTQPRLILLQKTMVVVEGVARTLDPELDMWKTAEPVVRSWIHDRLGPAGRIKAAAGSGADAITRLMMDLPMLVDRSLRITHRLSNSPDPGVELSKETVNAIADAEARRTRGGRVALWVIALALAVVAVKQVF